MKRHELNVDADLKKADYKYHPLLQAAILRASTVWASQEYYDAFKDCIKTNGLSGELSNLKFKSFDEIYEKFFEMKNGVRTVRLIIQTYYTPKRVIGYGVGGDDITRVNTKYLSSYTIDDENDLKEVGSNLTHEKWHDRGSDHDSSATARRKNSIAYLSNVAFEMAYKKLFIDPLKPTVPVFYDTVSDVELPGPVPSYVPWWKRLLGRIF